MKRPNRNSRTIGTYILIFALIIGTAYFFKGIQQDASVKEIKFSQFANHLEAGDYKKINISDRQLIGTKDGGQKELAFAPSALEINWLEEKYIYPMLDENKIVLESDPPESEFSLLSVLPTLLMLLSLGFLIYFMFSQGGNKQAFQFGKNRARLYRSGDKKITFADVAGLEEEKQELSEIVDFLKNPGKYTRLGARIPKGVLMVGNPGTGKTYISKATAGEAGVPFFSISGSDFVEMFVGVGASRVRDLFAEAKKNAPCIVFIDEIDAVGRRRGAGLGGGNDEREQTLNQLLVEMDGFDGNTGIIILAATNRPDVLDPALLRPGRFDRQVVIGLPDIKAREQIFELYTKNKPLDDGVSPEILAKRTPGFSPADIENLVNEAALLTARRNGVKIRMDEIEEATTKVMAGPQKKSRVISDEEKKLTAYHEAGHAIVMRAIPGSDPVHQITIIPRGMAGGFTMWLPEKEVYFETKGHMLNSIKHLLGGRVAEELKLDDISTGASNDLQRATETARAMISQYGFSEKLGPVAYSNNDQVFLGRDLTTKQNYSNEVASAIDKEIKDILETCYTDAKQILVENDAAFERVAQALLLVETIDGEQFEKLYLGEITPEELKAQIDKTNEEIKKKDAEEAEESRKAEEEERRLAEERRKAMRENCNMDATDDEFVEFTRATQKKINIKPLIRLKDDEDREDSIEFVYPAEHKSKDEHKEIVIISDPEAEAEEEAEAKAKAEAEAKDAQAEAEAENQADAKPKTKAKAKTKKEVADEPKDSDSEEK